MTKEGSTELTELCRSSCLAANTSIFAEEVTGGSMCFRRAQLTEERNRKVTRQCLSSSEGGM